MLDLTASMINTRDIEKRIEELTSIFDDLKDCVNSSDLTTIEEHTNNLVEWLDESLYELKTLEEIRSDICSAEFEHGIDIINSDHFTEYCKEMLQDCEPSLESIPDYIDIDWEGTAENLIVDYSKVIIDCSDFYYRD